MSLEMLPDEVILIVCSYLSQFDILQALNDLNYRLNCTISDYRKHLHLTKISIDQFNSVCQMLLQSSLGMTMRSIVLSNEKLVLKQLLLFEKQMRPVELNLPNLEALTINSQSAKGLDLLLRKILCFQTLKELELGRTSSYCYMDKFDTSANDFLNIVMTEKNKFQKLIFHSLLFSVNGVALRSKDHCINETLTHLTISIKTTDDLILIIHGFSCLQYLNVNIKELKIPHSAR
jgi:hypothetical protein